jgi:hypothetical protein
MFAEMLAHPVRLGINPSDFPGAADSELDQLYVDEAQDANVAQALLCLSMLGPKTKLTVIFDRKQRIFTFAASDPSALDMLVGTCTREFVLLNNFRSGRDICTEIQNVLLTDCSFEREVRCCRSTAGEIIQAASLSDLERLKAYQADGTVAFVCRLSAPLLSLMHVSHLAVTCYQQHNPTDSHTHPRSTHAHFLCQEFLVRGVPCRLLGRTSVQDKMISILDSMPPGTDSLELIDATLDQMYLLTYSDALMYDYLSCLRVFFEQVACVTTDPLSVRMHEWTPITQHRTCLTPQLGLQNNIDVAASTGRDVLTAHIYNTFDNGNARGGFATVTLATAHAAKGLEWGTVYIVEPSNMMLSRILAEGGIAAEDETHIKHVMISRARNRLIYLQDVFFNTKQQASGTGALFQKRGNAP